jgi:N6-adenosine-specific RNA methylase IME4
MQYFMYFSGELSELAGSEYEIIYADPPWVYNDKMTGHSFSIDHEYQQQDLKWIKSLPVESITARNAVLFLWAVSPQTPEAFEVMRAWGFKFKTLAFVWSKLTTNGLDVANLGKWTMGNVENVWLGVKGKPSRIERNIRQLVRAQRTIHSEKPGEVRKRIVQLMGDIPRIELFARGNANDGWDRWGNEEAGARTKPITKMQSAKILSAQAKKLAA